ncbi:MAG TPA: tetratricopeptide repeat protein [Pyrinomonadaceae bacterium]|jgi:Flp pilus assembly protein TadD/tRNA A-37 threonylcarbamoyl transferase component Bud32
MLRAHDEIGPFTLIEELGKGSFGVVWLAEERSIFAAPRVALKIALEDSVSSEAIKREAKLWVHGSGHINVLPIFSVRIYDEQIVIVSEYAPDGSLEEWLERYGGSAPSVEAAVDMMCGILAGLEHLHSKGIIHRDLKPANILLQGETPRLTDFGLARLLEANTHSMKAAGTFPYMAPEAFSGERSEQTDVWAAGVIFYQMLVGSLPFPQQDIRSLMNAIDKDDPSLPSSIPEPLRDVIATALQKLPVERYKSANEMRKALREASHVRPLHEHESIAPALQRDGRGKIQPLAATVSSPLSQFKTIESVLPGVAPPMPVQQAEPSEPKEAPPSSKSRMLRWIAGGVISLLIISALIITTKKLYSWSLNRQMLAAAVKNSEAAKSHVEQGDLLRDRSQWAAAEIEYRKAVQLEPNNAGHHLKLAYSLSVLGKNEDAQSEYREVERLARESLKVERSKAADHYYLGASLSGQDKFAEGEAEFKEAIRLNPNEGDYHRELGLTLISQGKNTEAEAEAREAIRIRPNYYRYTILLGLVLNRQEKYDEAEANLREAIRLNPNYAFSHYHLGNALFGQKRYDEADAAYREALRLFSYQPSVHVGLGSVLVTKKRYKDAELEYKEAIRLAPDETYYRSQLASFLLDRERYAEAEAAFREAIRLKPDEAIYHNDLGLTLVNQKKYAEAEAEYREAIRLNPNGALAHNNLGILLFIQKKYAEAEAEYREAIRLDPNEANYQYRLGAFLLDRKRYADAEGAFREAIKLNADVADYHNDLGVALFYQQKYAEAEAEDREAIRLNPTNPLYHDNLGSNLYRQGKFAAADAEYKEAKRLKGK